MIQLNLLKGGDLMGIYYNDKNVCFRIRVSFENQNIMKRHTKDTFSPLFQLKQNEYYSLKFKYKNFVCSHLKTKREFLYKDIQSVEMFEDGIILYLKEGLYISISVENSEKHNTELYDIATFLKRRCRWRFSVNTPIFYPEEDIDARYKSDKQPLLQLSFSLTDRELKQLLWYDYLFSEKMIVFIIAAIAFVLMAAVLWNAWLLIVAVAITVFCLVLSKFSFFDTLDGYIKNHQGILQMLIFEDLLVVRVRHTDLELEYDSMRRKKTVFGLWRLKCSDFFTLILPNRIVNENSAFFEMLYAKIK